MTKLCECGCGAPTPIAKRNIKRLGHIKGQPTRFVSGHPAASGQFWKGRTHSGEARAKQSAAKRGPAHGSWRGGIVERNGRRYIWVGQDHPMADANGYVLEHRLVVSRSLGRNLDRTEHVHHIDLNPLNNDIENLVVLTSSQHKSLHNRIAWRRLSPAEALAEVTRVAA